jgi:hypothetical protein
MNRLGGWWDHGVGVCVRRASARAVVLALVAAFATAGAARAAYEPAQILSESAATNTEFQSATEPVLSADGQWVAFEGENEGTAGVWERNVQTGAISPVATVSASSGGSVFTPPPTGASVSANGQFVAFTSETDPDPTNIVLPATDVNCPEVYVRNMAVAAGQSGAFTLVAELDAGTTPITFAGCFVHGQNGDLLIAGAQAAPGVAISADGSEVAFTVDSASNLGLPATDAPTACGQPGTTCQSQVAVRNLDTDTTTVVSVTPTGAPTPDGGAYPSATSYPSSSWGEEDDQAKDMQSVADVPASTAAISADGSTVAWMGTNLPEQLPAGAAGDVTAGMAGDTHLIDAGDPAGQEVEPLWRRISGPDAGQTTRLLAGAGLSFFGYTAWYSQDNASDEPPIEGGSAEVADPGTPALSADGDEAVVTAEAPSAVRLAVLDQDLSFFEPLHGDLYAIDMTDPSAPRVTPLTQIASDVASDGTDPSTDEVSGAVADPAISPDGTEIAFETDRTQFSLASPSLISPPVQYTAKSETYVVDLSTGTLQLATSTYDGLAPDGSSGVESSATNLVYGNVNLDGPEVYLVGNTPQPTAVATETISAEPRLLEHAIGAPRWVINARASARRTGTIRLRVSVPGTGVVRALATAQLPRGGRSVSHTRIPFRLVGTARAVARGKSIVGLTLALDRVDRHDAEGRHGLYARVSVRFTAPGHRTVRQIVPVTFRVARARPTHRNARTRPRRRALATRSRSGR